MRTLARRLRIRHEITATLSAAAASVPISREGSAGGSVGTSWEPVRARCPVFLPDLDQGLFNAAMSLANLSDRAKRRGEIRMFKDPRRALMRRADKRSGDYARIIPRRKGGVNAGVGAVLLN